MKRLNTDRSILDYKISPFIQVGIVFGLIVTFVLFSKIVVAIGCELEKDTSWLIACSFTLFYVIFNSIYSLTADRQNRYWIRSMFGFCILSLGGGMVAYVLSDVGDEVVAIYRNIYIVFAMVYVLLMVIMRFIRKLVYLAQQEDNPIIVKRK